VTQVKHHVSHAALVNTKIKMVKMLKPGVNAAQQVPMRPKKVLLLAQGNAQQAPMRPKWVLVRVQNVNAAQQVPIPPKLAMAIMMGPTYSSCLIFRVQ
jgi:hypothetical protein